MRALIMLWTVTKMFFLMKFRDRKSIITSLLIPVILLFLIGGLLSPESQNRLVIGVADEDKSVLSQKFIGEMKAEPFLQTIEISQNTGLVMLQEEKIHAMIVIPRDFQQAILDKEWQEAYVNKESHSLLRVMVDPANGWYAQIAEEKVRALVEPIQWEAIGAVPPVQLQVTNVQTQYVQYVDFLLPGVLGMMILYDVFQAFTNSMVRLREQGVLRHFQATPLPAWVFMMGRSFANLLFSLLQAGILLVVGHLFLNTQLPEHVFSFVVLLMLGVLCFMAIGLLVSVLVPNADTGQSVLSILTIGMLFLGGVWFPVESLPISLQWIVNFIPLSELTHAFREVMVRGANLSGVGMDIVILSAWLIGGVVISNRRFRWS